MNFKTTLILLVLVAAGGAALLLFPPGKKEAAKTEPAPAAQNETRPVFDPPPADAKIVKFTVEPTDKSRLNFERTAKAGSTDQFEDWRILEPISTPAESFAVMNLARNMANVQSVAKFEAGAAGSVTAAEAGLSTPRAVVTIGLSDGKELKFEVGRNAPLSTDTYVRVMGDKVVHVVRGDIYKDLNKDVKDFRSKNVARISVNDATKVEIGQEGKKYVYTKVPDGGWVIDEPIKDRAEREKVTALVTKLSTLRVNEFIEDKPESLAAYGLDQPYVTMQVTTETKQTITPPKNEATTQPAEPKIETITKTFGVAVGGYADMKSENRYVKLLDQPFVFSVPKAQAEDLRLKNFDDTRDKKITHVKAAEATRVELTSGEMTATLEKKDVTWQGAGDLAALEADAVVNLLEAFEDLAAIEFNDSPDEAGKYGLDKPRAILRVSATGQVEPVTLKVGANTPSGRNTFVQVEGRPTVYVVSTPQADRLTVTPLSLRSRTVVAAKVEDLRRVEVTRGGTTTIAEQSPSWRLVEPANTPIDVGAIRELVDSLVRLKARTVVAKGDGASYGLNQPAVVVKFTLGPAAPASAPASAPAEPATEQHTLRVSWTNNTAYCQKDDDPYVFSLDETNYRVFVAELIQRDIFDFAATAVTGFKVTAPAGTLDLALESDQWRYVTDPSVKLAQKKVKDFLGELAKMRVEQFIAYRDGDLAANGLEDAPVVATMKLKADREVVLKISQTQPGTLPRKAALVAEKRIFLLRPADAEKLLRGLDYYIETEADKKPAQPGQPGQPSFPNMPGAGQPQGGDEEERD